jgi:hypothetical protein
MALYGVEKATYQCSMVNGGEWVLFVFKAAEWQLASRCAAAPSPLPSRVFVCVCVCVCVVSSFLAIFLKPGSG